MSRSSDQKQKELPDFSQWRTIYPVYINAQRTIAQGRKLGKEFCVENPHPKEIAYICSVVFKLPTVLEPKAYSRNCFERGRIRVKMVDEKGQPLNPECKTRTELLRACGTKIPSLPTRQGKKLPNDPKLIQSDSKAQLGSTNTTNIQFETKASPVAPTAIPGQKQSKPKKNRRRRR